MAYEINININGDVEDTQSIKGMSATSSTSAGGEVEKGQKRLGKYIASQTIEPFIQNVKMAVSQDVGLITGNNELQERINFAFQTVQFGVNTYKNIQAGAIVGTQAGIGGGAGAVLGAALTAINLAINGIFKHVQIETNRMLENYQLEQTRSRAGIAFNKSRRG